MPELTQQTIAGSGMTDTWLTEHCGPHAADMMRRYGMAIAMGFVRGDMRNQYVSAACPKCDKVFLFTLDYKAIMKDGRDPMKLMVDAVQWALRNAKCSHAPENLTEALELYRPVFEPYIRKPSGLLIPSM